MLQGKEKEKKTRGERLRKDGEELLTQLVTQKFRGQRMTSPSQNLLRNKESTIDIIFKKYLVYFY